MTLKYIQFILDIFGGGGRKSLCVPYLLCSMKSSNICSVTGSLILFMTASAVAYALGNDLSVLSLIKIHVFVFKSNLHSIILLLYCFSSFVTLISVTGRSWPPTKRKPFVLGNIPIPLSCDILSLKSMELCEDGFHFRMLSSRPVLYGSFAG